MVSIEYITKSVVGQGKARRGVVRQGPGLVRQGKVRFGAVGCGRVGFFILKLKIEHDVVRSGEVRSG